MPDNEQLLLNRNYFYGTEDHYYHPGWYFDVIVDKVEKETNDPSEITDLSNAEDVRPGRFVLVRNANAVFMRTSDNEDYYFVLSSNYGSEQYFYNDFRNISGKKVSEVASTDLIGYNSNVLKQTTGFRFIAYTNRMAQILLQNNGSLVVPYSTNGEPVLYSTTNNLGYMASYYFGL